MKTTQEFLNYFTKPEIPLEVDGIIGTKSRTQIALAINKLKNLFTERNWIWNDTFNFIGIRTDEDLDDTFDDWFVLTFKNTLIAVPATTTAGVVSITKYLNTWINGKKGVGTIAENQQIDYLLVRPNDRTFWNSMWTGGKGFLYQDKVISKVYRGAVNKFGIWYIDKTNFETNNFGSGFNVHTWRGFIWKIVGNLSEGCQTTPEKYWDIIFPILCEYEVNKRITYSLIQQ